MDGDTKSISTLDVINENTKETLKDIHTILEEKGYNATSQIVGYLISGDLGYISSYKDARSRISSLDRGQLVEFLLTNYLK